MWLMVINGDYTMVINVVNGDYTMLISDDYTMVTLE